MKYNNISPKLHLIDIFNDPAMVTKISNNESTDNVLKNIIIGYFNDAEVTTDTLNQLKTVDYMETSDLFYMIPMVIYCLENYVSNMLS
jgi:hypothetical protein